MTQTSDVVYLADHPLVLALPALMPAFIVAGVVIVIAVRDRRRGDDPDEPREGDS
jgi:hypothetical protein